MPIRRHSASYELIFLSLQALIQLQSPSDIATVPALLCRSALIGLSLLDPSYASDISLENPPSMFSPEQRAAAMEAVTATVSAVVPGMLKPAPSCPPKVWELVQYLRRYRSGQTRS